MPAIADLALPCNWELSRSSGPRRPEGYNAYLRGHPIGPGAGPRVRRAVLPDLVGCPLVSLPWANRMLVVIALQHVPCTAVALPGLCIQRWEGLA